MEGFALHQVDVLAGFGHGERRVDAGDAAAHHQNVRVNRHARALERRVQPHAVHRRADQVLGLRRGRGAVRVHPRVVLADVHHLEEVRVDARLRAVARRKVFSCRCGEQAATTMRVQAVRSRMSCLINSWPGSEHMYL